MELLTVMEQGARDIAARVAEFYAKSSEGMAFLWELIPALEEGAARRAALSAEGGLSPQYLICSITSRCNLHCAGCYARAEGSCSDEPRKREQLGREEWAAVFNQARELGISFILLAGGEPLLRRDVLQEAAKLKDTAFPVFTNGTLFDEEYLELFAAHRNLIPVVSIEGEDSATDARRGEGVAQKISGVLEQLQARGILFAASVTVTRENLGSVATEEYIEALREKGCGVLFFIEYVPAQQGTEHLALKCTEVERLSEAVSVLRERHGDMCIFSFPGDEAKTDGCLAAGRGFFHINPSGGAEPCPFSPFSVMNVREHRLKDVLSSEFFGKVREVSKADESHFSGCTLFNHQQEIFNLFGAAMEK